jgi:hypothetical protein
MGVSPEYCAAADSAVANEAPARFRVRDSNSHESAPTGSRPQLRFVF